MPKNNVYNLAPNKDGTWDILKQGDKQPVARLIPIKKDTGKRRNIGDKDFAGYIEILKQDGKFISDFDSILNSLKKKTSIYNDAGHKSIINKYQVKPDVKKGWIVMKNGNKKPYKRFEIKKNAIKRAKELAKVNLPGTAEIYKLDGTLQSSKTYPIKIVTE
jgi:hypothetical protein